MTALAELMTLCGTKQVQAAANRYFVQKDEGVLW